MNSEYILSRHNRFLSKKMNDALEFKMSAKIQKIRKKIEKLEKEANELKLLKSDYQYAKQFRRMIVKQHND